MENVGKYCPRCFGASMFEGICSQCGYISKQPDNPMVLKKFTVLNSRYIIGITLGIGGFGITYSAYDTYTKTRKAIKEYFPNHHAIRDNASMRVLSLGSSHEIYSIGLEKFSKEAGILFSMGGIASVVRVDDYFNANGTAYMVMEYVDGISLREVCKESGGRVPFPKIFGEFVALAKTLEQIHAKKLLHRDVSPDNIMMLPNGSVKLIDFGAARYVDNGNKGGLTVVLKPGFAPIEQYTSKGEQGPWTDIYGLACCIYWYASGVKVPEAQERFYKNKTVEPLYKLRPEVSKNFSDIIEKAMAIDAKKRYRDVASMLADLDDETSVVMPPFSEPEKKSILNFWQKRKKNKIYFLQIIGGPFDGYLFPFPKDGRLTVGRNNQKCNAVMPPVDIISRRHCTIELDNRNSIITITDHSSTGTYRANGDRLPKEMPVVIPISEEFFLADRQYTMQIIAVDG